MSAAQSRAAAPSGAARSLKQRASAAAHPSAGGEEDSGRIDLRALLAEAEKSSEPDAVDIRTQLTVYPFGAPAEASAPQVGPEAPAPLSSRKAGSWLAGVGAFAAIVGVAAIAVAAVVVHGDSRRALNEAEPALSPVSFAQSVRAAASFVAEEPAEAEAPAASGAAAPPALDAAESPAKTPEAREANIRPHIVTAPVVTRPQPVEPKEEPPVEEKKPLASDSCNGDLMCAMQRAVQNRK